ncbi:hypothetical protein ACFQZC_18260 [Streptacidiphilus monticola]
MAELHSGSRPGRLPSLTGLRTAAALMVFGFHIYAVALFASPG